LLLQSAEGARSQKETETLRLKNPDWTELWTLYWTGEAGIFLASPLVV